MLRVFPAAVVVFVWGACVSSALRSARGVPPKRTGHRAVAMASSVDGVTAAMKEAAVGMRPFDDAEVASAMRSLRNVGLDDESGKLRALVAECAHRPPKDWAAIEAAARRLSTIVDDAAFHRAFDRALEGGGWARALEHRPAKEPWVVLVTGVNGIRKTSSMYEPKFASVLAAALEEDEENEHPHTPEAEVPVGANAFFRQLDYIVATVANDAFATLYAGFSEEVEAYAARKDAIFARYRTLSEIVGARLLLDARARGMNVLVETSGRDIGMFAYVDHFFCGAGGGGDSSEYRKLVLNFEVNDVTFAEASVERRMLEEMRAGAAALASGAVPEVVIRANAGGPYGPSALRAVQADSVAVFKKVLDDPAFRRWRKARVQITADDTRPWTVTPRGAQAPAVVFGERPSPT